MYSFIKAITISVIKNVVLAAVSLFLLSSGIGWFSTDVSVPPNLLSVWFMLNMLRHSRDYCTTYPSWLYSFSRKNGPVYNSLRVTYVGRRFRTEPSGAL